MGYHPRVPKSQIRLSNFDSLMMIIEFFFFFKFCINVLEGFTQNFLLYFHMGSGILDD